MGLEAMLTRMESLAVTPVTPVPKPDVTPKPAPPKARTPVTPRNSDARNNERIEKVAGKIESDPELFAFTPPGDPANDDEALRERVAIMMEGNDWDEATALQEARWGADRERCWRGFLLNAKRILGVPRAQREALLGRYRREATKRYGERAGADMAAGMAAWVTARGLH